MREGRRGHAYAIIRNMKRTTVFLDESLNRDLQTLARQEGRPVASLVREALATYVGSRSPGSRPTPSFTAIGGSGRADVATRHESLLWRDLAPHGRSASRRQPKPPAKRR
jgi:hypothetical protein